MVRKNGIHMALICVTCLAAIAVAPGAARAFYEVRITTDPGNQYYPAISGNKIVWEDYRNGNADIYLYDIVTGTETRITSDTADQLYPAISGNKIVWEDHRNGNADIYLYDIVTGTETRITSDAADQLSPAISGNKIVWEDYRNGNADIYLFDLDKNIEASVISNLANQWGPAISGNRIVWTDTRRGSWDIYCLDLDTKIETPITTDPATSQLPAISGDRIVWIDNRSGFLDLYLFDLASRTTTRITSDTATQVFPRISGERIVWQDWRNGNSDIYLYDIATGKEPRITVNPGNYYWPVISEDRIVWQDERNGNSDIYLVTLGPDSRISPLTYDFGQVAIGSTSSTIVTVSNVGNQNLVVDHLVWPAYSGGCNLGPMDATGRMGGTFGVLPGATLPATLGPGQTMDITVTFAPEFETTCSNHFGIWTNDPHKSYSIEVSGTGVRQVLSPGETPAGDNVSVTPVDSNPAPAAPGTSVTVTFDNVTKPGETTVTSSPTGTPPPAGFKLGSPPAYYEISTTADVTPPIEVCINYTGINYSNENKLRLFHRSATGGWEDVTTSLNTTDNIICGKVSSLSPFAPLEADFQFVGFFEPIYNGAGVVNLANAGRTIPAKWQLLDGAGGFISDLGAVTGLTCREIPCPGSNSTFIMDPEDTLLTSSVSGLRFDFSSNQFVYTWKTDKAMAGSCYRLNVELFHLDNYTADFEFE